MEISIRGASENNLQNLDVDFHDGLTVVTGVSGSGKSSLVFNTLYHEARRRFLDSFATGASGLRLAPAAVESIRGLGPAVAVGQNLLNRNPNSTLATFSGLHPFFRLLYARFGERVCARCGKPVARISEDEMISRLTSLAVSEPGLVVFAPLLRQVAGSHRTLLDWLVGSFDRRRLHVDGKIWDGSSLAPDHEHNIEIELGESRECLTAQAARKLVRRAASLGIQALVLRSSDREWALSRAPVCVYCGQWFGDIEPAHFLFPCRQCQGKGCAACGGSGLPAEAAAVRWQGLRLDELLSLPVSQAQTLIQHAPFPECAARVRQEIMRRLETLQAVGLGYVSLNRPSPTLSRGEGQRVRLAVALTSRLEDMLHVLDEPTIGQHPADVMRLLPVFRKLGGPVIYVEHDRVAAAAADQAVDLGPGAGKKGGRLLFAGTPAGLWQADTPTGRFFSLRERVLPAGAASCDSWHQVPDEYLVIRGAFLHNLQGIDVTLPLHRLTVVTGVSGSGKSTLVEDVLAASLKAGQPLGCRQIEGRPVRVTMVDQSPIGVNPRSNPATYTGLADIIRDLFAAQTGLSPSHFSFNRPQGACPTCKGMGAVEVAMRYLPATWVTCADCQGLRFADEVLAARAVFGNTGEKQAFSIADFFNLPVGEALPLLTGHPDIPPVKQRVANQILQALHDVGLDYLPLGQPSPTLSGGESQRVKLTRYLGRRSLADELLILDEPSTGLHPQDMAGLLVVLHRLVRNGATIVVVEHNLDMMRAADWIVDLGPGAGPEGGKLLYAGPPAGLLDVPGSQTAQALKEEDHVFPLACSANGIEDTGASPENNRQAIRIRGARENNLQHVDVDIPKSALTVVTGVSGSGKSSLVSDVLEAEARRRFLESLSMYERQAVREGAEAEVDVITGLGVTASISAESRVYGRRATVGTVTDLTHYLAILLSLAGERDCERCGAAMSRDKSGQTWHCGICGAAVPVGQPRHFQPGSYAAACLKCHGVGTMQVPRSEKLIIHPEKPLLGGAMYSPGFFPKGYLGKPFNGGYDLVQSLAAKYSFDPSATPWNEMTAKAQNAFLFGDPEPMPVVFHSRTSRGERRGMHAFPGFYGWVRDWDTGGTYTDTRPCPECGGARLRPEFARVRLAGYTSRELNQMPLSGMPEILGRLSPCVVHNSGSPFLKLAEPALVTALRRLRFLNQTGLGYLQLDRPASSLSAGEAQRIRLAGLLGSELTALTILLDEPTRGLHPSEVEALREALLELRDSGNTVVVVEHDLLMMQAADHLIDMGPGAGAAGGRVVASGSPDEVRDHDTITARWLRGDSHGRAAFRQPRRDPRGWMTVRGARANNLRGVDVRFPSGVLLGVCGVSGSGKSSLVMDTLGRALVPKKYTTSVASEPVDPGEHDTIENPPQRALLIDQTKAGVTSPADYLGIQADLIRLYAAGEDARALGISEEALSRRCTACGGSGQLRIDMGFLPDIREVCDVCRGTGFLPEAWHVRVNGKALPDVFGMTVDEVYKLFKEEASIVKILAEVRAVGLGYLVLRQPGYSLSGGEAQRLKIAAELCRKVKQQTLYVLDEPTVGQHLEDVARLNGVLHRLVDAGHTVLVIEHHPHVLAACDWLIELGPGGGPQGGRVIAEGTPETIAHLDTPTAPYLREVLEGAK